MSADNRRLRVVEGDAPDAHAESEETLWRAEEAGRFLQKSRSWVYQHAHTLPCFRLGGELRFRPAGLREYVREQERAHKAKQG